MKLMIMGLHMLLCCSLSYTHSWPDKPRSEPTTTEKNKSTRFSKLLSISYESSTGDQDKPKAERRIYDSTSSGFRDPKFCQSCNDQPWIPVVKFSQRAPKNIIYQEEQNAGGEHNDYYNNIPGHLTPPQSYSSQNHISHNIGDQSHELHPQVYDSGHNTYDYHSQISSSQTYGEVENHVIHPQAFGEVQHHLTPPDPYYNHNQQPQQQHYSAQAVSSSYHLEPEVAPHLTPCDLMKQHNHDSLSAGSEAINSIENDEPLVHHLKSYKEPPPKNDKFFKYFSYVKHPDVSQKQNMANSGHHNYQESLSTNIPLKQMNQPNAMHTNYMESMPLRVINQPIYPKREKELFPIQTSKQIAHFNMIYTENDIVPHSHQYPKTHIKGEIDHKTPERYLTNSINKPPPALANIPMNILPEYPHRTEMEDHLNQNHSPYSADIATVTANVDENIPAEFLTPPRLDLPNKNRDGRGFEHFMPHENSVVNHPVIHQSFEGAENSVSPALDEISANQNSGDQQHLGDQNINYQDIIPPEDRAAQLQALSNAQLDYNQLQFDQKRLRNLSPVEWQCFLMNFIRYLKMSKAGYQVRMSHECDSITLQQFMSSLNTDDQKTDVKNSDDIATNEIKSNDEDYTKNVEEAKYAHFESTKIIARPSVQDQHQLVKLAPHLSGEYFVNTEYVKNYSQIAQEAVNNFIRQNENLAHTDDSVSNNLSSSNDQNQKVKKDVQSEYHNHVNSGGNNTSMEDVQVNNINNLEMDHTEVNGFKLPNSYMNRNVSVEKSNHSKTNEHYLNYQEIVNNNNIFQDMLDAFTDSPSDEFDVSSALPYPTKTSTAEIETTSTASKSTTEISNNEISPPKESFYPKGFSLTKYDQSSFVTEKPILLTAPKKIKIVIPYRKKSSSEIKKDKEDESFHKSIDTWTADGYSNHKLSHNKLNQTTSFNAMQKSKSIPLLYLNSTLDSGSGNEQSNISGNASKSWEDLTVAISPYTKERVYVVTPKSN